MNALAEAASEVFIPNKIDRAFRESGFYPQLNLQKVAQLLNLDDDSEQKETLDSIGIEVTYSDLLSQRSDDIFHQIQAYPENQISVKPAAFKDPALRKMLSENLVAFSIRNEKRILPLFAEFLIYIRDHPNYYNKPPLDPREPNIRAPPPLVMSHVQTRPETPNVKKRRGGNVVIASGRLGTTVEIILAEKERGENFHPSKILV